MKQVLALIIALLASLSVAFAAVNVNTATETELQSLNGIGPTKAKAIIDYRAKNGPFKSLEELDKVPGIGPGTLAKIRSDVTLTGKTTVRAESKGAEKKSAAGARESAEDTSRSKPSKTTARATSKDSAEQRADKKSATGEAVPSSAQRSTKEADTKTARANEKKSASPKKDESKPETAR